MKINSVHLVTMCQMETKNKKKQKKQKKKTKQTPFPFQTILIGKFTKQPMLLSSKFNFLSSFSVCLSVYEYLSIYLSIYGSIHPSTHRPTHAATHLSSLFEYQTQAASKYI